MQQTEIVVGFSELKELLIRTHKIDRAREQIRLYFTENNNQLILHDYHDHKKAIILFRDIKRKLPASHVVGKHKIFAMNP